MINRDMRMGFIACVSRLCLAAAPQAGASLGRNDVIVGAVADGAGSAKYSDIGSKLAVETALKYLSKISEYLQKVNPFPVLPTVA